MPNENENDLGVCCACDKEKAEHRFCENCYQDWNESRITRGRLAGATNQISELELEIARRDEILNNAEWIELPGGIIIYPKGTAKHSTSPECVFRDKSGEWDVLYAETVLEAFDALKETGKGETDGKGK